MLVSVTEAASLRGVSPRRLRQLIDHGLIPAHQIGGRWVMEWADATKPARLARPMGPTMTWLMIDALSGSRPNAISSVYRTRVATNLQRLADSPNPVQLLSSWLARRARRIELQLSQGALMRLYDDQRFVASGISDPRSGMSAPAEVEGYVTAANLAGLRRAFPLLDVDQANVFVHLADQIGLYRQAPIGLVLADLCDWPGPREQARAKDLLTELLSAWT